MIVRLYTGDDGQSHFEDLNIPSGDLGTLALKSGAGLTFHSYPDGWFVDWHTERRRQYVIVLSGRMEIGVGDGTIRRLGPGDIVQAEDVTGQGHTTRTYDGPRVAVSLPMPD